MKRTLEPYREASLTKTHMVWGVIVMLVLIIVAFILVPVITLA